MATLKTLNTVAFASIKTINGVPIANVKTVNTVPVGNSGFVTKWTVAGDATARTITLPLVDGYVYDCVIDWGDGSADSTVTTFDDADRIHTYAGDGTYDVTITGTMEGWSFNNAGDKLKIVQVVNWGSGLFNGFKYLRGGFYGCTNLTSIGIGKILASGTGVTTNGFRNTFTSCTSLTSIPAGLFDYNINVSTSGFSSTFYNCSSLASIPTDLFKYNTAVSTYGFSSTFYNCTSLTSIPTDLFKYNTAVSTYGFYNTFDYCTSLTSIPVDLFRYNTAVSSGGFANTFYNCTSLTSIPVDLFRYNTAVSSSGFYYTFSDCTSLTSIPDYLFKYNIAVSTYGFDNTFNNCPKLQVNPWTFYASGEEGTRFLNRVSDFTDCFYRATFTGVQGTAPALWDCDFGTETPVKTACYGGAGNSATSLTNYADIPAAWK